MRRFFVRFSFLVIGSFILSHAAPSRGASYTFVNIADTSGPYSSFLSSGTINDDGTVAFWATLDAGGRGIFTRNMAGGVTKTIADTTGAFADFSPPSLNNAGTVAFTALIKSTSGGGSGVFSSSDGGVTVSTVASTSGSSFTGFSEPAINAGGTATFRATSTGSVSGIYTAPASGGGPVVTVADSTGAFASFGHPVVSSIGVVAFSGTLDNAITGIYTAPAAGGSPATMTDSTGPLSSLVQDPTINAGGAVAFPAGFDDGGGGIFTSTGGNTYSTIATTAGPFQSFGNISINDLNAIAFTGAPDGGPLGIYVGANPATDKVIAMGDPLFGATIGSTSALSFSRGLNNNGDIVFGYALNNGVQGIAVAHPVPEPSAAVAITLAAAVATGRRARLGRRPRR